MTYHDQTLYWKGVRPFRDVYVELWSVFGLKQAVSQMKEAINTSVVEHDLVYEGFVEPYLKLVDAMETMTEALFELFPKGGVWFELTEVHGIKMLFATNHSTENGKILSMIDVGWVYASDVGGVIEERLSQGSHKLERLAA